MEKGNLLFSEENLPEIKNHHKKERQKFLFVTTIFFFSGIIFIFMAIQSFLFKKYPNDTIAILIIFGSILMVMALWFYPSAYYFQPLRIFENGIEMSDISYLGSWKIIRGNRELYVPFSNIDMIVLNSDLDDYAGIAVETKDDKEYGIPKNSVMDKDKFEKLIRLKVKDVRDAPPKEDLLAQKVMEG